MGHRKQIDKHIFELCDEENLEYSTFDSDRWIENEKKRILSNIEVIKDQHSFLKKLVTNTKSSNIVDYGGSLGTGYFILSDYFKSRHFKYTIVETKAVVQEGPLFLKDKRVNFVHSFKEIIDTDIDIVYSRTALQYSKCWKKDLELMAALNPKIIALNHLSAGKNKTFRAIQRYYGKKIPYWFINTEDLRSLMKSLGYSITSLETCESFNEEMFGNTIPKKDRIKKTIKLILKKVSND